MVACVRVVNVLLLFFFRSTYLLFFVPALIEDIRLACGRHRGLVVVVRYVERIGEETSRLGLLGRVSILWRRRLAGDTLEVTGATHVGVLEATLHLLWRFLEGCRLGRCSSRCRLSSFLFLLSIILGVLPFWIDG